MSGARLISSAVPILLVAACGASRPARHVALTTTTAASRPVSVRVRGPRLAPPRALVTAETENRLLVVDLPGGRVSRRVTLPADPEDIAATGNSAVVVAVSARAGKVTVLDQATLHTIKTFRGFDGPHIAAISRDGRHAYITDDTRGTLTAIRLSDMTVTSTVTVGQGAHHLTFSPDQRQAWIALGESATQISILDTTDPDHPRLSGHFRPGFLAHDLSFSQDGRRVWVTSATGPDITAFDARDHRALFRVRVGAPPQHLAFEGGYAYLTSGYGATIEKVDAATGRVLVRTSAPYGSFELAAADGYVANSSLLRGTLAIFNPNLKLLRLVKLAPATREVAIAP